MNARRAGSKIPGYFICLEDNPRSIEAHLDVIKHYGLDYKICSRPLSLGNLLESRELAPESVQGFILDMHVKNVNDLSEIDLPGVTTLSGEAVGLAVAESYLKNSRSRFRDVPIAFLTGFEIHESLWPRISALSNQGGDVVALSKASDLSTFEDFVRSTVTTNSLIPPFSFGAIVTPERAVPDGQVVSVVDPLYTTLIRRLNQNPDLIHQIDARQWEEIIAATYAKEGFDEVILTPRSGDLGRDVIAVKRGLYSVRFIEQVKAYSAGHLVTADEVRSLLGVLHAEQNASKAIFSTTSFFAPRVQTDKLIKSFLPYRLELVDKLSLLARLRRSPKKDE